APVAVLRSRLAERGIVQRMREPVDLRTVIVKVVLPRDISAARGEQPAQRVTDGGPPRTAQMDRTGWVCRDELEVDPLTGHRVVGPVVDARLDAGAGQLALRAGGQGDVEKSRTGHVDLGDAGDGAQPAREQLRQRTGV